MDYEKISAELSDFLIQQSSHISIMPQFEMNALQFVSGNFGPFKVNKQVSVPLWVAVHLKKLNKCRIYPPVWLSVDELREKLKLENEDCDNLTKLPESYYEIAQILISSAPDDIKNCQELQTLLEDLEGRRDQKINILINAHLDRQKNSETIFQINNISSHEINKRRQVLSDTMSQVMNLNQSAKIDEPQQTQKSQN